MQRYTEGFVIFYPLPVKAMVQLVIKVEYDRQLERRLVDYI